MQYSSQPQAAPIKRKNYRDDNGDNSETNYNIMNDPRVIRGSTFAPKVLTLKSKTELITSQRTKTVSINKKNNFNGTNFNSTKRSQTPPPVEGRSHMMLQTDDFLDELSDKPVISDVSTQTLAILDRPASPLFIRAKIGKDIATEILENELFDFDLEVNNILEVLINKTLNISMLELMQEEELENIKRQQKEFETIRNVELVEVQRLENEEKRKINEKNKRVEQEKKRIIEKKQLENKIAARSFAQQYLTSLHTDVFDQLELQGVFVDPIIKEVEVDFLKPLITNITYNSEKYNNAKLLLDDMLNSSLKKAKEITIKSLKDKQILEEKRRLEEEEKQKQLQEELLLAKLKTTNNTNNEPTE